MVEADDKPTIFILDPSSKMDLDFWDCFGKEKKNHTAHYKPPNLDLCCLPIQLPYFFGYKTWFFPSKTIQKF